MTLIDRPGPQAPTRTPIIDSDAHITEAPDLWTSRVASRWGDLVPHTKIIERPPSATRLGGAIERDDGKPDLVEMWFTGDVMLAPAGGSARATWSGPFPTFPPTFEEVDRAAHDGAARLAHMDDAGVYGEVLYPNVGGFGSQTWRGMADQELALECVRAYNDFLIDWVSVAPERFAPMASIPFWDIDAAVAETNRAASIGHRGIIISGAPQDHDQPMMGDPHWDRLWHAAADAGLVVSFHLGSGNFIGRHAIADRVAREGPTRTFTRLTTSGFIDAGHHLLDLLLCGVLDRHPTLQFFAAESGIGWIPFVLESADYHFHRSGHALGTSDLLPSELFRRQVHASFWYEDIGPQKLLDDVGVDNVLFETDFPHPTCLHPKEVVHDVQRALLDRIGPDAGAKVFYRNAARLFGFDAQAAETFTASR